MARRSLFWRLYLSYAIIILLCLAVVGGYAGWELGVYTMSRLRADLEARANLAAAVFEPLLSRNDPAEMEAKARARGRGAQMRVTVIAADGRVVADSEEEPSRMENHSDRPEVKKALLGEVGSIERHSNTLKMDMLYLAIPVPGPT